MSEPKTTEDLKSLKQRCDAAWKRPRKGSPPISYSEIETLFQRIDTAETRVKQLERKLLSCVFCGFVGSDVEQLKAHSAMCEKHPIAALKSENERLDKRIEGLIDKYEGCPHTVDCGCAQDKPSDICAHHAPQLRKALAENAALKREVSMWRSEHDPCPFSLENETLRAENERLEKQVARFLEPKGRPINPPQEPK